MAELREALLRCLLAIYEMGRTKPDMGIQDIARALDCAKAFVTEMAGILVDMDLPVWGRSWESCLKNTVFAAVPLSFQRTAGVEGFVSEHTTRKMSRLNYKKL